MKRSLAFYHSLAYGQDRATLCHRYIKAWVQLPYARATDLGWLSSNGHVTVMRLLGHLHGCKMSTILEFGCT